MYMKELIKQIYNAIDPVFIFIYRLLNNFKGPIPPARNRARVGNRFIKQFMKSGKNCYLPVSNAIKLYYKEHEIKPKVLDFGAGVGRTLQYFAHNNNAYALYACDVDSSASAYLLKAFPDVKTYCSQYVPPLVYQSNYFDIVYSVSIWTHLPLNSQEPWLDEIYRILKPGGIALLTTIGTYGFKKGTHLQSFNYSIEELVDKGIKYCEYENKDNIPGTGESYGATYQTIDYTKNNWNKKFTILDIQEGVIDDLNDLVILRK